MYCFNTTSPTDYDFHFSNHHLMADAFILITIVVLVNSLGCRAVVRPLGKSQLFTIQPTRSSSCLTLSRPPVTSHLMFSNRAISITAPRLWNDLPPELDPHHFFASTAVIANHKTSSSSASSIRHPRAFHSKLKSHLFKHSFPLPISTTPSLTATMSPPGTLEIGPELLLTLPLETPPLIRHSARE